MIKIQKPEGLNVIPFIDIILVLLAMILSISTFVAHGEIKLELPKTDSSSNITDNKNKIQITINAENIYFIDDKKSNIEEIRARLNSIQKETIIELRSDKRAEFNAFIQIVDILRKSNHDNFQILTEKTQ